MKILLGVSASIAAYRALDVASQLRKLGHEVAAVLTPDATRLVGPDAFQAITGRRCITSVWAEGHAGDMDHLALTKWADAFVVAPATADIIARLAHGLANDALTTFAVAFNKRPLIIAPAMNPEMWRHAATQANVDILRSRGHHIVGPDHGDLACGDHGPGRLVPVQDIVAAVLESNNPYHGLLSGETVLITGGPTREFADPVRFLSNPSTGLMALELAKAAKAAGASVTLVLGPSPFTPPDGIETVRVVSADDMLEAVKIRLAASTIVVFAAAVSDWRPTERSAKKERKTGLGERVTLELERTTDIARFAGEHRRPGQVLVGFSADSHEPVDTARGKLERKHLDLVFANPIDDSQAGFGAGTNRGWLVWADRHEELPLQRKADIAAAILKEAAALRGRR